MAVQGSTAEATVAEVVTQDQQQESPMVLKLHKPKNDKKVQWREGTVDNEFMGKKSSKCCCIYSKPHKFGESDTESDSDGGDDDCCHEHRVARRRIPHKHHDGPSNEPSASGGD